MIGTAEHPAFVGVRLTEGVAGFSGVSTCGSVWACAVCSAKVMARRALEIGCAVASAPSHGLEVAMLTFTVRHDRTQRLDHLWSSMGKAWRRATSGKGWMLDQERHGIVGTLGVVEVTYGANGWHPHRHALVFGEDLSRLHELGLSMHRRWTAGALAAGLATPLLKGSEWHKVYGDLDGTSLGQYLAKGADAAGAIGMELTQTQSKGARRAYSTEPVWTLLDRAGTSGDALRLWHEWERVSRGKRQISWSQGLRELLGLVVEEQTDEEIASEELGTSDDTVLWITKQGYAQLVRHPWMLPKVLDTVRNFGPIALSQVLTMWEVDHQLDRPAPPVFTKKLDVLSGKVVHELEARTAPGTERRSRPDGADRAQSARSLTD